MSDNSAIEWTDATWNPVTGCTKVSPGCDNCYAETFAERFRCVPGHHFEQGFDVVLRPERLDQPLRWKKPRRVFVNSMSDLFHEAIPDGYVAQVFAVMALAEQHTFQVLTKRHGRMRSLLRSAAFRAEVLRLGLVLAMERRINSVWAGRALDPDSGPLPNVWLGVSVEDQKWADIRVPALLDTPAAVRWLSCEPLLGPVDLTWCDGVNALEKDWIGSPAGGTGAPHPFVDWVVVGGESGHGARPMHPDWARGIRDACVAASVPYFFKQHGEWLPLGPLYDQHDLDEAADEARMDAVGWEVEAGKRVVQLERTGHVVHDYQPTDPRTWLMARVGKKRAGRELDGRTWDEYPAPSGEAGERSDTQNASDLGGPA